MTPLETRLAWVKEVRSLIAFMHKSEREETAKRLGISVERVEAELGDKASSVVGNVLEVLADHIDALTEERDIARRAIEPFAMAADACDEHGEQDTEASFGHVHISYAHLDAARTALGAKEGT